QIFAEGEALPDFDCQCPLLSLPLAFGTRLETIPAAPLYLYADAGRVHAWNARLGNQTRPRIGLAWSGNAKHKNDLCRSIPLAELGALAGRRGQFVSLQKEVRLADQAALKKRKDIAHFGGALSDFAETAALVANMDLVVTVDTAIAHLAGALGKPVWLLLPFNADWRWLQDRDDSPWYPSFRLFRQPAFGDWGSVIAEVGEALRLRLRTGRATPPPAAVRTGALPRPARRGKPHAPSSATLGPNFDALHQAGLQALSAGDMARGIELIRQALAAAQGDAAAHTNLGIALGRLGRFAEALDCYAQALRLQPDDAITLNGQGNALLNLGRAEEALACYRSALRQQPDFPEALNNQGNALRGLGRPQEALACYADAIRLRPGYADAHNNRGNALQDLGRWEEALASHAQALRLKPGDADALNNLGNAQRGLKRPEDALASYQSALRANPGHAQALNNCGNALLDLKRPEDALECYGRALRLQPDNAETLNNRGTALHLLGRADDALRDYAHALRLKPDYAEAHCNVGIILHGQNRFAEALDCYGRALRSRPDYAEALNNRGFTLQCLQRPAEALASYAQATRAKPDYGQAHWNHSMLLRALGDYEAGWRQYEWRWQAETFTAKKRDFSQPLWLGEESLRGKTILLHAEQGLGDTLQFCRYAKLVAAQGARVLLEVQPSLRALLARLEGVGEVVSRGDALPAFDCHCPLLSLPLACGTRLDSIPAEAAYLRADPGRVRHWRATLADTALPRIGLAWSGNPAHKNDHNRSLPLACLAPLLSAPAQFVSLQKDLRPEDAAFWESHGGLAHYGDRLADFEDTAALAANLDLVIAVDTSSAHLAAAMGKPVWLLLPFVPDWRWLMDRDGSPWYPSVRLFRQSAAGDWGGVVAAAANALAAQQWPAPQHLTTTTDPQP
ncbi:MAG: tetratricopeptide repeat protein, partial [Candidatus Methylumidiphilus sp.]